jgi:2-dehydropantoate 2-reductase
VIVAIVGAGAIGGLLGAHLAQAGEEVTVIARGPNLRAIQTAGLTVRRKGAEFRARVTATDEIAAVRAADIIFITLKAHAITAVAPAIGESVKPTAAVVGAMNGLPWWYFDDRHLESVDPGGVIARSIPRGQVVGSVIYPAAALVAPGVVEHEDGDRISIGEPDGTKTERVVAIARMLVNSGFKAPVQSRLRTEIWLKLLGNATLNPLSAITRATMEQIFATDDQKQLVRSLMAEVAQVALAYGIDLPLSIEKRMAAAEATGPHKTSMLQDLDAGRPLETDALLGSVIELADAKEFAVPGLRQLYVLTKLTEVAATSRP